MDVNGILCSSATQSDEEMDLRRGPWTMEEDVTLMNYIANHGEGRWNSLARCAGLKRTGKSCRLRWLNYLRPDVRRENITLETTSNPRTPFSLGESVVENSSALTRKNRLRNQKLLENKSSKARKATARLNSKQFKDTMRYLWMPRLVERIQAAAAASSANTTTTHQINNSSDTVTAGQVPTVAGNKEFSVAQIDPSFTSENSSTAASSDSFGAQVSPVSDLTTTTDYYHVQPNNNTENFQAASLITRIA